jgi:hypothetical protein
MLSIGVGFMGHSSQRKDYILKLIKRVLLTKAFSKGSEIKELKEMM